MAEIERQLMTLPTREIAGAAWERWGEVVVVDGDDEAIALSDEYAPEHLEMQTARNDYYLEKLKNYGSLFVGEESTVAYGDKGVGTNHTLPTGRAARYTGGLWVGKFLKTVTYQRLTAEASERIAPIIGRMCAAEGMLAHEITAKVRDGALRAAASRRLADAPKASAGPVAGSNRWRCAGVGAHRDRIVDGGPA